MQIPSSDLFTPLTLSPAFNIYSDQLDGSLAPLKDTPTAFGEQYYLGMPFSLGQKNKNNAILLDKNPVQISLDARQASYIIFLHRVERRFP